ncbi:conserved Plasmodium protein, unknown function [Plasmodium berghei]|uniref:GPI transamidase component GPI17 n=2 Tax=Plasmodium berghei TaxID=5821 RepID=A0A509ASK1_PLABA|nr:conserved Plasmodium protein, unknown function [Plasmodium berghei ANKA]CXJ29079.1 conserved Plasmodium protein, unknown function [Plasmodium berghei]SCM27070.1 conserved Plasmodium protein, unknown function [Plasmodium berghei]SCN28796.1 conserved Plasmodium protein, unknown function [Plasmodium berghei]VUC58679.1 conserved Plasmodium protein, unknown function [Plasmodium berghei ANKA]|eukprot:XP_034424442.1 conserved Plasmodium protein, unknown function [Plasmodium berghei ANKA]
MNSRSYCVFFYTISLFVYIFIIYSLNKYERHKLPIKRLEHISAYIQNVHKNGSYKKNIIENENSLHNSNLIIKIYIVCGCKGKISSNVLGSKLKEYMDKKIISDIKKKGDDRPNYFIKENDLFDIKLDLIDFDKIQNYEHSKYSSICKNSDDNFIKNTYYIYIDENDEKASESHFILSTSNIIEILHKKIEINKEANIYYEKFVKEAWNVITNFIFLKSRSRLLNFVPEIDLNFYLASSLYNKENYKKGENTEYSHKKNRNETEVNKSDDISLNRDNNTCIATWDFYTDFYYPYMQDFVEKLLNIFQINIYQQIISNINIYKISEKKNGKYIKDSEINKITNKTRLIILDKVTKFTNTFDDVIFSNILKRPTYEIPKNINLITIFPNEHDIYFYNHFENKIETAASFIEWGIIYINNSMISGLKRQQVKTNKQIVNVSSQANLISSIYISHLRKFLGLCSNFSDYIYNIFNPNEYDIKNLNTISEEDNNLIIYSIKGKDDFDFLLYYNIPLKSRISDYETLGLMREAFTHYINETIKNMNKFISISNISIYIKIPNSSVYVFNNILNNLECSIYYMQGKRCEYISDINETIIQKFHSYMKQDELENKFTFIDKSEDSNNKNNNMNISSNKMGVYYKIGITLARAAYQDSLQLLKDDSISIYEIMSKDFLLASILPILIPCIFPTIFSFFREFFKGINKRTVKAD